MINTVTLSGTVVSVEEKGALRIVVIEGMAYDRKTKQEQPTLVQFKCFGDRTGIAVGSVVVVRGEVECRDWQGKLYTDIIARDFEVLGAARPAGQAARPPAARPPQGRPPAPSGNDGWDDGVAPF